MCGKKWGSRMRRTMLSGSMEMLWVLQVSITLARYLSLVCLRELQYRMKWSVVSGSSRQSGHISLFFGPAVWQVASGYLLVSRSAFTVAFFTVSCEERFFHIGWMELVLHLLRSMLVNVDFSAPSA